MAHIVILGVGIGGSPTASELCQLTHKADRVSVISNSPSFLERLKQLTESFGSVIDVQR